MNSRLLSIIRYKTGGKQTEFAALMGWTPQYLAKLLKGENFGLQPILTVLSKMPEINARWFLFGEGDMMEGQKFSDIQKTMFENISKVLEIEKFMPVMSPEELRKYEQVVRGGRKPDFSPELVDKWQGLLRERQEETDAKFKAAASKSDIICRQRKVKR